jgi:hypothetical protein
MEKKDKQVRWFRTDVDFENSFKFWFALQWQNKYIQIFAVAFPILIWQIINYSNSLGSIVDAWGESVGAGLMVTAGSLLPLAVSLIVSYKGFYQYYDDLSKGKSR